MRDHQHFFLYLRELKVEVSMGIHINRHVFLYLIKRVTVLSVDEDMMWGVEEAKIELIMKHEEIGQLSNQMVRLVDVIQLMDFHIIPFLNGTGGYLRYLR